MELCSNFGDKLATENVARVSARRGLFWNPARQRCRRYPVKSQVTLNPVDYGGACANRYAVGLEVLGKSFFDLRLKLSDRWK